MKMVRDPESEELEEERSTLLQGPLAIQQQLVDKYVDQNQYAVVFALSLAAGNAADAVEIMCIGYIMNEIDGISTQEKGLVVILCLFLFDHWIS
jgi:hypothetical protein